MSIFKTITQTERAARLATMAQPGLRRLAEATTCLMNGDRNLLVVLNVDLQTCACEIERLVRIVRL